MSPGPQIQANFGLILKRDRVGKVMKWCFGDGLWELCEEGNLQNNKTPNNEKLIFAQEIVLKFSFIKF